MNEPLPIPCTACNGAGTITTIDAHDGVLVSQAHTCNACGGTGRTTQ